MKILHVVPSYKPAYLYGGTIESVARLCEGLVNAGEDVKVFTTTANGTEELDAEPGKEYIVDGVNVTYFKRSTKDHSHISFPLWKRLYKDCRSVDVVHIHSWWNILVIVSAMICRFKKVRIIFSPHGMLSDYIVEHSNSSKKKLMHILIGKFVLKSTILHATSEPEFAECRKLIPGWKGFMIPNIVWLPELAITKKINPKFTIIFLSRIHPKKGIELLLEAMGKLKTPVCLKIAGTGEKQYIKQLKKLAKDIKIEHLVEWLGWKNREDKFDILMQADLFALTSYNENFANVVVESLHVGTPVFLSDKVGLAQFVEEYSLGWCCSLDATVIEQKLEAIIADKKRRNNITDIAPAIIKETFSEEKLIPQYIMGYVTSGSAIKYQSALNIRTTIG